MSPTKQAKPTATKVNKGDSGKEPKLPQVAEWRRKKNYTANKHKIMIQAAL